MPQIQIGKQKPITEGHSGIELMKNIVYVNTKTGMDFNTIMELPYAIFLSYLKHLRILEIESTPEGRQALQKSKIQSQTEPDFARIRSLNGYQRK